MTLGYKFRLSIYSLIHQVLENVGSFVAFAQTPLFHFFSFSSAYSPISFNLFLLFIYYSTAVTTILFSLYPTRGEPFSVTSSCCIFFAYFPSFCTPHACPSLDPGVHARSCFTKRNTPCRNTLLNIFRHCTCIPPRPSCFLFVSLLRRFMS